MISRAAAPGIAGVAKSAGVSTFSPEACRKKTENAPIPDLGQMFAFEWMERTKAQGRNRRDSAQNPRERTAAVFNTNQNRIEETKERGLFRTEAGHLARYRNEGTTEIIDLRTDQLLNNQSTSQTLIYVDQSIDH